MELQNCELYSGAFFYAQPCFLPIWRLPPIFLALFFATGIFLIFLFRHCRQEAAEEEAVASPTKVQSMTTTVYEAAATL